MEQQRAIRKAMADFFAGQQFFDFYTLEHDEPEPVGPSNGNGKGQPRNSRPR
jgi:hypothetical protein